MLGGGLKTTPLYVLKEFIMKKIFLIILYLLCTSNLLWCQNDFFPLKVGNKWNYSYKSTEKEYLDIAFINKIIVDSGNVKYAIVDSSEQDSIIIWNMEEHDIIQRHIIDYNFTSDTTDTTYLINTTTTFQLIENLDSLHTLTSKSYYEVFTFPIKWENFGSISSMIPITRFRNDSSVSTITEFKYTIAAYSDSLVFQQNKGLVYAQAVISKGPNVPYYYKWEASLSSYITDINAETPEAPQSFSLYQNYPNPFNPETNIVFSISKMTGVTLTVYDILGRVIKVLVNDRLDSGKYNIKYRPTNISSGLLFYQLKTSDNIITKKMMYIK